MCFTLVMPSNNLNLFPSSPLAPNLSYIRVFSSESALHIRWPNIGASASASVLPMNIQGSFPLGWAGLISLLDLPQGTFKSLLQHHSLKASILQHSAFFIVQLSHPYIITGKTTSLTIQSFVIKVMSLLFNILSRFVIAFLPRSEHLLISWLQSPSTVILEPKK